MTNIADLSRKPKVIDLTGILSNLEKQKIDKAKKK